ncbi:transcription factor of the MADS box [Pseudocyphellaria aurata]|nr:transcription factor of the MADS box [Pseudocyphellaria aurata]
MADLADPAQSPSVHDDAIATGNGNGAPGGENRGIKRPRPSTAADDDEDDEDKPGRERRKIDIKFIQDKSRRHITFSKRKAGIMKKVGSHVPVPGRPTPALVALTMGSEPRAAYELSVLTGTQVLLLVVSETGLVYTFTTPKLQPLVTKAEGKNLIQACLNAPEPAPGAENGIDGESNVDSPEEVSHAPIPAPPSTIRNNPNIPPHYITPEQQQQMAYQQYMQQQQQQQGVGVGGQYPMPPQSRMPHQQQPSG